MPKANFIGGTSRMADVVTGVVLALADVLLVLAIIGWALYLPPGRTRAAMIWLIVIFSLVAVGCARLSWRLLTGRRRPTDAGLVSPFFLRFAALGLVLGAVASAWLHVWSVLEVGGAISMAGGALMLARKRESRGATESPVAAPIEPD